MRTFVIWAIVLLAVAGTACNKEPRPSQQDKVTQEADAGGRNNEPPNELTADLGKGVKLELVLIPAGEFVMGSGESAEATAEFFNKIYGNSKDLLKAAVFKDEHPQYRVRITKPFYLGTSHVTRGQFRQFVADAGYKTDAEKGIEFKGAIGWNPGKKAFGKNEKYSWWNAGFEQTDEHPVVNVSWNDAEAFCEWMSRERREGVSLADGGGMGICVPRRNHHTMVQRGRPGAFAGGRERRGRDG